MSDERQACKLSENGRWCVIHHCYPTTCAELGLGEQAEPESPGEKLLNRISQVAENMKDLPEWKKGSPVNERREIERLGAAEQRAAGASEACAYWREQHAFLLSERDKLKDQNLILLNNADAFESKWRTLLSQLGAAQQEYGALESEHSRIVGAMLTERERLRNQLTDAERNIAILTEGCEVWEKRYAELEGERDRLKEQLEAAKSGKDTAYSERDRLVCAISKVFSSWLERHPDSDLTWENDWRWIVFVNSPTGQASWHIHDSELAWFDHLERKEGNSWDGHSTTEKYARIERFEAIGNLAPEADLRAKVAELEGQCAVYAAQLAANLIKEGEEK